VELGVRQRGAATLGISAVAGRAPGAPLPPMACNGERFSPAGRRDRAPYSDGAALQAPCKSGGGDVRAPCRLGSAVARSHVPALPAWPRARAWAVRGYRAGRTFTFASPAWAPARARRLPDSGSGLGFGRLGCAPALCARLGAPAAEAPGLAPAAARPAAGAGTLLGFTDLASLHGFCMRSEADAKRAVNLK